MWKYFIGKNIIIVIGNGLRIYFIYVDNINKVKLFIEYKSYIIIV